MTADLSATVAPTTSVVWGQSPHAFSLHSTCSDVIDRAAVVFQPWSVGLSGRTNASWTITPDRHAADHWIISSPGGADSVVAGSVARVVTSVEFRAVQVLVEGPPDSFTVHAALVARNGRGVLILGPSESGKSTLACALWRRGFALVGDDLALVDLATGYARPAPRRVSLRGSSRVLIGDALWTRILTLPSAEPTGDGYLFHPCEIDGLRVPAVRLAACVFLARWGRDVMSALVSPLPAAQAAMALLPYSNMIRRLDGGALIPAVGGLTTRLASFDLDRAPLTDMVAAIERLLEQAP